ncbi:MAG: leucine-rich repeat domain-containing protein [Pirellula sp.]|jgi:hypothetical protein
MLNQSKEVVFEMWNAKLLLVWLIMCLSTVACSPRMCHGQEEVDEKRTPIAMKLKVLVLNYDPFFRGKRLHEVLKFNDPRTLADGYIGDMRASTNGLIEFEIVEWRDLDEIYAREDGGIYKVDDYVRMRLSNSGWPASIVADYPRILNEQGVLPKIDEGLIDEVWVFGDHYFGLWEASMAGPEAFFINGGVYPNVPTLRPFAIYGFNYERGVAEMLHNTAHRVEATMNRTYGTWDLGKPTNNWELFSANASQSNGTAGVGTCHWPANAQHDYDYANRREIMSYADDFLNYPNLTFALKKTSAKSWSPNGEDPHRGYMNWYFARLPKAAGVNDDGKLNSWLPYIFDFQNYDRNGEAKSNQMQFVKGQFKTDKMAVMVGFSAASGIDPTEVPVASAELIVDGQIISASRIFLPSKEEGNYRTATFVFSDVADLTGKSVRLKVKGEAIQTLDQKSFQIQEWKLVSVGSVWEALPLAFGRDSETEVARWVIKMGGKVGLSGRTEWIEDVDNIPAAKELLIERISLVYDDNKRTKVLNLIDLGPFAILKELTSLELRGHPIGDRSCTFLAEMVKLKKLNLHACSITDAGLKRLEPLSNLESLDIGYSLGKITDEGAKSLLKMPKLKHMNIYSSSISDETLRDVFAKLPDLESVELTTTNVTENGIAELKKANPKLNVIKY